MVLESWLPIGFEFPDGEKSKTTLHDGIDWQIIDTQNDKKALLVSENLLHKWVKLDLVSIDVFNTINFSSQKIGYISSVKEQLLCPLMQCNSPNTKAEALAIAIALKNTRERDLESPLQDSIYIEKINILLPTFSISSQTEDDIILGFMLTGGVRVSVNSFRRFHQMVNWLSQKDLKEVIEVAGFKVSTLITDDSLSKEDKQTNSSVINSEDDDSVNSPSNFTLPGRPELESFFNEHVIEILQNSERYKALGIGFPSAIALHGPPGCGKTFAVEKLVDFLGWPSFDIDASSVASPYIHDTSKKVAEVFAKAMENSPSVLIIDEMESFLADREMGSGHHRVEEVAEFLRRIPEATANNVLIIAMTNRIEIIDPAILRRGRFDHIIRVDFAGEADVASLLDKLLSSLPLSNDIDIQPFAKQLAGRPLSDVSFIVREGARLAARSGKNKLDQECLELAISASPTREAPGDEKTSSIGFI